ncbi:MAG: hypothetical protein HY562_04580 [Ignavibacteriales bacterium]|nr:hypothetical protein [Ignavibacteriales bacterium]
MKTKLTFLLLLTCSIASTQDRYVWLKLSDESVIINGLFRSVNDDTLIVENGMRRIDLPLDNIIRIRLIRESAIFEGALYGTAIGLGAGSAIGFIAQSNASENQNPLSTALVFTVVGGVVGIVKSAFEKPEPIINLETKSVLEKRRIIESLFTEKQETAVTQ